MTYVIGAVIGSALTVAALYAYLLWNEWRWDQHCKYWDNE